MPGRYREMKDNSISQLSNLLVVFMHVPQYGFHQEVGGMYMMMAKMVAVYIKRKSYGCVSF